MSENRPSDYKLDESQNGTVTFATDVIATIAGLAANEVEGVANMSTPSGGFTDMFARKNTRNFSKGVKIELNENRVTVDVSIVLEYGSTVPDVARGIQENVKKAIETMSGLDVHNVDVHVTGISFEKEQQAAKALDEQQRKMLEESEKAAVEAVAAEENTPTAEAIEEDETDVVETEETEESIFDEDFIREGAEETSSENE